MTETIEMMIIPDGENEMERSSMLPSLLLRLKTPRRGSGCGMTGVRPVFEKRESPGVALA